MQYRDGSGRLLASFTGQKIRSRPAQVGVAARCCAAVEASSKLEPLTDRFFKYAQAIGFTNMEYKKDERTGQYFMIEPPILRADLLQEVSTLNGVNCM